MCYVFFKQTSFVLGTKQMWEKTKCNKQILFLEKKIEICDVSKQNLDLVPYIILNDIVHFMNSY